jgi:hypothetical protein
MHRHGFAALATAMRVATCSGVLTLTVALAACTAHAAVLHLSPAAQEKLQLELRKLRQDLSQEQHDKLRLEVVKLRNDTGFRGRIGPFVPALAAVAVIGAGALALWQHLHAQREERHIKRQEDISDNIARLVEYPELTKGFNGSAVSALRNLESLTVKAPPPRWRALARRRHSRERQEMEGAREQVTDTLVPIVIDDLDFGNVNHARFPTICMTHWPLYSSLVSKQPDLSMMVLHRYESVLEQLHDEDPAYFETVTRTDNGIYAPRPDNPASSRFRLFRNVVDGYERYVPIVMGDDYKFDAIDRFKQALCNSVLTSQLFGETG